MIIIFQTTTAWLQLVVEKWVFTFVNLHFSPGSEAMQQRSEISQNIMTIQL